MLIPDNLKSGVIKNTKDELVINRAYRKVAEYYGAAIIPARPRAPKDKATVEGAVGIVSTFILAALRNQQFLSLRELNGAIRDRLTSLITSRFKRKAAAGCPRSRRKSFSCYRCPSHPFELAAWKIATAQYNYHVSMETQNYSCQYEYIKQKVDVRLTKDTVEISFEGNRIASHPRLYGHPGHYSTLEAYMPPEHQKYVSLSFLPYCRFTAA